MLVVRYVCILGILTIQVSDSWHNIKSTLYNKVNICMKRIYIYSKQYENMDFLKKTNKHITHGFN